jgi:peptidoglycan hydrolase-like protein with peptidoglycan-binding domain
MFKKLLLVSAISAAFAASPSFAQQQGGNQQNTSNQRITQEQTTGVGTPIYISTAGVRQIQQRLNQAGFDVSNVDGIWSNQTAQGARDYQKSNGLEPTGTLTLSLLNSLGLQNVLRGTGDTSGGSQGGQQGGQRWAQEAAVGEGTPLHISPAGIRQIQQELNKRGYDVGRVDGQWGDNTAKAAANFQQANGLEPNGKPDVNLIAVLGGTQEIFSGRSGQTSGGGNMRWAQESATGPGVPVYASPATVRQIQQGLNQQGYDVGRVDGNWGKQTVQAARDFQRTKGLEPTGTLTTSLLASLGYNNWMSGQTGQSSGGGQQGGGQSGGGQGNQQSYNQGGQQQGQQVGGFNQSGGSQGSQSSGGGQQQGSGQSSGNQGNQRNDGVLGFGDGRPGALGIGNNREQQGVQGNQQQ